jgi:hypothetical protein
MFLLKLYGWIIGGMTLVEMRARSLQETIGPMDLHENVDQTTEDN